MEVLEPKDDRLWRLAKRRAAFKRNLFNWFIINSFLWFIWSLGEKGSHELGIPWPIWPTVGWGIGLCFQYYSAYIGSVKSLEEKEYEKLKRK